MRPPSSIAATVSRAPSVDLPITGHYTRASPDEPALAFGLILRPAAIASVLLDAGAVDATRPAPAGIGVDDASPELLDAVVRMLRLLDTPDDRELLAPRIAGTTAGGQRPSGGTRGAGDPAGARGPARTAPLARIHADAVGVRRAW